MTSPRAGPPVQALGESLAALAAQMADLHSQVALISQRLDRAGVREDVDLVARLEELAGTVATALDAVAPRGPAAPFWIGLDHDTYRSRLAELRRWADTVLRQHYGGYELRDCWPRHIHAVWELSTLAAEWHRTYNGGRSNLTRALEFYDRWLRSAAIRSDRIVRIGDLADAYRSELERHFIGNRLSRRAQPARRQTQAPAGPGSRSRFCLCHPARRSRAAAPGGLMLATPSRWQEALSRA